jgi:outer membrane protein
MKSLNRLKLSLAVVLAGAAWLPLPAPAQNISLSDILPNFVGVGIGGTSDYAGSDDYVGGLAPGGFYKFGGERFISFMGVIGEVNLLDSPNWRFGPSFGYRFGREDVDDDVVARLPEIDGTVEVGLTASYAYLNTDGIPWKLRFGVNAMTGVSGDDSYDGAHVAGFGSIWLPLSKSVFVGAGAGVSYASSDFMQTYFEVTPQGAAASGLPVFEPGSGVKSAYAWPAVIVRLSDRWVGGAGVFYQRLLNDAADSPIVDQRGDADQFTGGIGLAYTW